MLDTTKETTKETINKKLSLLSPREKQVFLYISSGLTHREISVKLSISHHTVKNQMTSATNKYDKTRVVSLIYDVFLSDIIPELLKDIEER